MNIRLATLFDATQMDEIYRHYIENTVATFLLHPLHGQNFAHKMEKNQRQYPFLIAEDKGEIVGYAYGSPWRYGHAYRWDVELSIYIRPDFIGQGVGKNLYEQLLHILTLQGYKQAYGGITLPNPASIALHEKMGFRQVGIFHNTGYKQNQWLDVIWFEKQLAPMDEYPQEPKEVDKVVKKFPLP